MIDRKAFHTMSYGLYVISSKNKDGKRVGCVANTLVQVASDPAMISVALNKDNATTKAIAETGIFSASVLAQTATMELIGRFGFNSSNEIDKFDGVESAVCASDIPYLVENCVSRFVVKVKDTIDAGTHLVFVGTVEEAEVISDAEPLTYDYYHTVLKGKTPPRAASYDATDGSTETEVVVEEQVEGGKRYGWRCSLCGYIVEMDELPDDFVCPICGADKSFFERIEL